MIPAGEPVMKRGPIALPFEIRLGDRAAAVRDSIGFAVRYPSPGLAGLDEAMADARRRAVARGTRQRLTTLPRRNVLMPRRWIVQDVCDGSCGDRHPHRLHAEPTL